MTSEPIDQTIETVDPEAPTAAEPELTTEATLESDPVAATARRGPLTRPLSAIAKPVSGVVTIARSSVAAVGRGARSVATRLPTTFRATRSGAIEATTALQTLPDPTLRSLAATSVGIGAGLYLARAPKAVVMVGVVPAMLVSAAIALRPTEAPVAAETSGPDKA